MINQPKIFYQSIPYYLTLSLPIFLITGPFLSDLSITVCCIIFLINLVKNNLKKYYENNLIKFFLVFNLVILLSSLFSEHKLFSLKSSFFYFRFYLFAISVFYLIDTKKNFLINFFYVLSLCFYVLVIDGYIQYFFNKNIIGLVPEVDFNGPRISSFFGTEIIMGSYLSRLFPLYLGLFFFFFKKMNRLYINLHIIFLCLIYIIIFLTGERTAFFIINCVIIILIFLISEYRKKLIFNFIILLISLLSILYFKPEIGNRIIKYTYSQFQSLDNSKIIVFSPMHTGHYTTGIKMFLDKKILGIGPNNFRKQCDEKKYKTLALVDSGDNYTSSCSTHPHNIYIQLLAETGVVGFSFIFCLFLSLVILSLRIMIKKNEIKINNFKICLIAGFLTNLFPLMPSGNFFNNYINIIYFLPLGFYMWSTKKNI